MEFINFISFLQHSLRCTEVLSKYVGIATSWDIWSSYSSASDTEYSSVSTHTIKWKCYFIRSTQR